MPVEVWMFENKSIHELSGNSGPDDRVGIGRGALLDHALIPKVGCMNPWRDPKEKEGESRKRFTSAAAAGTFNPFAGPVPAVFRFATTAWKTICGG